MKNKSRLLKLWNSPSFTGWGNQATQALRLLAVTPLIVTRFKTEEIAAWYLFGTLMFLGDMIVSRMGLTFSRMISFGMAGANDLAPIRKNRPILKENAPNWSLIERAYGTIGFLNLGMTTVTTALAAVVGLYGLKEILAKSSDPGHIWIAFAIFVISKSITDAFQRYILALKGMNYVALSNRWDVAFSLISVVAGFAALSLGANIWQLALTMQSISIASIFRNRALLMLVEDGRFRYFRSHHLDREIFGWAWIPFVKGLAVNFSHGASAQFVGVVFARHGSLAQVGAFLFSMRILATLQQISMVPYNNHMPMMSRLIASGDTAELAKTAQSRTLLCQGLFAAGTAVLCVAGEPLLRSIGANINFLSKPLFATVALGMLIKNYLITTLSIPAIGNDIVCFWRSLFAGAASVLLAFILVPTTGITGLIIATYLPQILFLNIVSTRIAADRLDCSGKMHFFKSTGAAMVLQLFVLVIAIIFN